MNACLFVLSLSFYSLLSLPCRAPRNQHNFIVRRFGTSRATLDTLPNASQTITVIKVTLVAIKIGAFSLGPSRLIRRQWKSLPGSVCQAIECLT